MIGIEETSKTREAALLVLGGVGVVAYGLTRGAWAGLALATAGGFMTYCGLRRPGFRLPRARVPPADSPVADRFLRDVLERRVVETV